MNELPHSTAIPPTSTPARQRYIYIYLCLAGVEAGGGLYDTASGVIFFIIIIIIVIIIIILIIIIVTPTN
jgi:hypothetical protein